MDRYFRALVNFQELEIEHLDLSEFLVGFGEYLGHFSPTLRSVALCHPKGTHQQLLDFFRLFPKLEDIGILGYHGWQEANKELDSQLIPIAGGFRGRLTLCHSHDEGLLKDMVVAFGLTSVDLDDVRGVRHLLEACADTLETLRIIPRKNIFL